MPRHLKKIAPDSARARVTLSRVGSSHTGNHIYVYLGGREIGELHRPNPDPGGPDKKWKATFVCPDRREDKPCGSFGTEESGIRRIVERHTAK